jgi:hypothetical protein
LSAHDETMPTDVTGLLNQTRIDVAAKAVDPHSPAFRNQVRPRALLAAMARVAAPIDPEEKLRLLISDATAALPPRPARRSVSSAARLQSEFRRLDSMWVSAKTLPVACSTRARG